MLQEISSRLKEIDTRIPAWPGEVLALAEAVMEAEEGWEEKSKVFTGICQFCLDLGEIPMVLDLEKVFCRKMKEDRNIRHSSGDLNILARHYVSRSELTAGTNPEKAWKYMKKAEKYAFASWKESRSPQTFIYYSMTVHVLIADGNQLELFEESLFAGLRYFKRTRRDHDILRNEECAMAYAQVAAETAVAAWCNDTASDLLDVAGTIFSSLRNEGRNVTVDLYSVLFTYGQMLMEKKDWQEALRTLHAAWNLWMQMDEQFRDFDEGRRLLTWLVKLSERLEDREALEYWKKQLFFYQHNCRPLAD